MVDSWLHAWDLMFELFLNPFVSKLLLSYLSDHPIQGYGVGSDMPNDMVQLPSRFPPSRARHDVVLEPSSDACL